MSELCFEGLQHGELANVSAAYGAGRHVIVGHEHDGTGTLIALSAGVLEPAAGRVRLDGVEPWSNAQTRSRIASLCASEPLLPSRNVASAIALALRARGDSRSAHSVLDAAGLGHFANKRPTALTPLERRAIALSFALSHREPALLALHEPLSVVGLVPEDFVLRTLNERHTGGAIVLCTAARLEDAARLGGQISALDRGRWIAPPYALPPPSSVILRVHTPEPRRLSARLSEAPDISGVEWAGGNELLVHGSELARLAHSVVANARAEAIRIFALKADAPALEALATKRAALARAYYEQSGGAPLGTAEQR